MMSMVSSDAFFALENKSFQSFLVANTQINTGFSDYLNSVITELREGTGRGDELTLLKLKNDKEQMRLQTKCWLLKNTM